MSRCRRPVRVLFSAAVDHDVCWLLGVTNVGQVGSNGRSVQVEGTGAVLATVAAALVARGIVPVDLRAERPSLEDAFRELTGAPSDGPRQ